MIPAIQLISNIHNDECMFKGYLKQSLHAYTISMRKGQHLYTIAKLFRSCVGERSRCNGGHNYHNNK